MDDSENDLDALLQSLSPPKYDTPSLPGYEKAAKDLLDSEQGQRTSYDEFIKLGESAEDIDISFKKVARGLDQALKAASSGSQRRGTDLRETWQVHHKTYINLFWKSRRVVGHARATATDFAEDFLPVFKDGYSIDDKKKAIAGYLQELEQDQKNSQELFDGLRQLRKAIAEFEQLFEMVKVTYSIVRELKGEIVTMQTKLGMFERVWRCVVADLNELEMHLERVFYFETKNIFEKKIERTTTIYKTIDRALYLYETNTHI